MKTLTTSVVITAAAILAGCGIGGGDLVGDGGADSRILVVNGSNATLSVITVSTCSAMSHGFNRLPSGTEIAPGQSYPFPVSAGCYDVQAGYGYGTGYAVADFNNISVPAGRVFTLTVN